MQENISFKQQELSFVWSILQYLQEYQVARQ